jgi:hypothetical protein
VGDAYTSALYALATAGTVSLSVYEFGSSILTFFQRGKGFGGNVVLFSVDEASPHKENILSFLMD